MGVSIRDTIIAEIKTTLASITTGNGYNLTVNDISEILKNPVTSEIQENDLPALVVLDGEEVTEDGDVDSVVNVLDVLIVGYVKENRNETSAAPQLRKLMADVEKCLMVDRFRGGYANNTIVRRKVTDQGSLLPYGIMNMNFDIEYLTLANDPDAGG